MYIDFNREKLENALSDFVNATGIPINITDENFNKLYKRISNNNNYCTYIHKVNNGPEKCNRSDNELLLKCRETKTAQFHICYAGLVDVGVPLIHADTIIGYLILGQMKKTAVSSGCFEDEETNNQMKKYYDELVQFDEKRITSIINVAIMLAKHILLEKMFYPVTNECLDRCIYYINENLSEHISMKKLSSAVGYSTSEIYKSFHKYQNCTVGDFLTKRRIDFSANLLLETNLSVEEISVKCGFSSAPYFSKKFKEIMGVSPITYRKKQ